MLRLAFLAAESACHQAGAEPGLQASGQSLRYQANNQGQRP